MSEAFNPDYLRQHLRPLAAAEADAAVLAYQAYYCLLYTSDAADDNSRV